MENVIPSFILASIIILTGLFVAGSMVGGKDGGQKAVKGFFKLALTILKGIGKIIHGIFSFLVKIHKAIWHALEPRPPAPVHHAPAHRAPAHRARSGDLPWWVIPAIIGLGAIIAVIVLFS